MQIISAIVQGVLLGGLYALFAAGLSFMFGVMRIVNLAHGALAVLAAYGALMLVNAGVASWLALIIIVPVMAGLGYLLQRIIFQRTLDVSPLPSLLVTFGLAIVIENLLLVTQSANQQRLSFGALDTASITLPGDLRIGVLPLLVLVVAIVALGSLSFVLRSTPFGRLVRSVSDDPGTTALMGANPKHIYGLAAAIAFALVAIAGVAGGVQSGFNPASGGLLLIYAFEAVIIGGLGSLWGTLLGSMILGVVQTTAAFFDATLFQLAGHVVFLLFLLFLPQGLIRRKVRQ